MSPYTQANRSLRVKTVLGDDALLLASISGTEAISELFAYELELLSERGDIDFDTLLGKALTARWKTEGGERFVHGYVSRFSQSGGEGGLIRYRAHVVPWLWFLGRRTNCRIFQDVSVPDILKKIFSECGVAVADFAGLRDAYAPRTYCVQYRESDLDFVLRLMAEEGIWFHFEHADGRHTLHLVDGPDAHTSCPGQAEVEFLGSQTARMERDHVFEIVREQSVRSALVRLRDFNFETPSLDLLAQKRVSTGNEKWELFDYPGRYETVKEGTRYAALRLEGENATRVEFRGIGHCRGFAAGFKFKLKGHARGDMNNEYLVIRLTIEASEGSTYGARGSSGDVSYKNTFTAVKAGVPVRPPMGRARPVVEGPQTAIVVGPKGEEIHTDKYGRVKAQFHWDREGQRDEKSSCWIRVSMGWAGKNWGAFSLPRIGQEVIVDFLEGDPDRPIITGRVYHAESMPPYELPAGQTKSTIKSRSTKGGGPANFNEIRFDDKRGSEELFIHAEKDELHEVENNQVVDVGVDQTITVGSNQKLEVGTNQTVRIGANREDTVVGNETRTVQGSRTRTVQGAEIVSVLATRTHSVAANEAIAVGAAQEIVIGAAQSLNVGAVQSTVVGASQDIKIGTSQGVSIGTNQDLSVGQKRSTTIGDVDALKVGKKLTIEAGDEISITAGKAKIVLKKDGTIRITGKDVTIEGSGAINVKATKDVVIKGQKILEN